MKLELYHREARERRQTERALREGFIGGPAEREARRTPRPPPSRRFDSPHEIGCPASPEPAPLHPREAYLGALSGQSSDSEFQPDEEPPDFDLSEAAVLRRRYGSVTPEQWWWV